MRLPRRRPRLLVPARDAHPRRRRQPLPRVRRAPGRRAVWDRGEARAEICVRGERVRVGRGAVPAHPARGDRPARVERPCPQAAWRRRDRPLPQLRAHRAGVVRQDRDRLRARAHVRTRMSKPLIGITTYVEPSSWGHWADVEAALVPYSYVRAVERAGGRAVLVPPDQNGIDEVLDALDGLVFSGGNDLEPDGYGAEAHRETTGTNPERDRGELSLLEAALARDLPVLAICRGFEVLNVARGGDIVQHLPEIVGHEEHREVLGEFSEHTVRVDPSSRIGEVRGPVMSHHHQGIDRIGEGLREVAWAEDGTVEGIEDPEKPFVVGVLWHPEAGEDQRLFEQLVEAARKSRPSSTRPPTGRQ